ncbi:YchJ family protein [Undibacterium parvum]|uniref:YchJ-like middle NTF2-like domain-containing protein n=1 Tax=Undibacterium parvum TaxID=401471 RepID=A0A3S9HIR1_9BURK|nr:YchJ family metal-binding protein [Undibacterium parvum]AZP12006.1 hypothetical protein EJN92_08285 [Undibacterium parvum]
MKCPCDSGKNFELCCQPYLTAAALAPNAEALMRSRYTAYSLGDEAYLRATWDERTLPSEQLVHDDPTQWLGLEIKRFIPDGGSATVEFVARYKIGGRAHRLHEVSRFVQHDGKWLYVDGTFPKK